MDQKFNAQGIIHNYWGNKNYCSWNNLRFLAEQKFQKFGTKIKSSWNNSQLLVEQKISARGTTYDL